MPILVYPCLDCCHFVNSVAYMYILCILYILQTEHTHSLTHTHTHTHTVYFKFILCSIMLKYIFKYTLCSKYTNVTMY